MGRIRGLKGHESIAQALAWVYITNESALKGRQKIALRNAAGFRYHEGTPSFGARIAVQTSATATGGPFPG